VILDVMNFADPVPGTDPTDPWSYGVFVNGKIGHNGSGNVIANVHCNQDLRSNGDIDWDANVNCVVRFHANGAASVVNGTVKAPVISGNGAPGITDPQVTAVDTLEFPVIRLTEYYNIAVDNGQVFGGGPQDGNIGVIPGGVRWYNGDVRFNGGVNYSGCIIATGDIVFRGSQTQTRVGNLPAAISRDGNIVFNGSRAMEGLVYAFANVLYNGSGTLDGSLVVGGDLIFNGVYGVVTYTYSAPGMPGDTGTEPEDEVGVTAWQK